MKTEQKTFAVITFVDGTKGWFENPAMAQAVTGWYEKSQRLNAIQKAMGQAVREEPAPKPASKTYSDRKCRVCGNDFSPHSGSQKTCDECRAAGRKPEPKAPPKPLVNLCDLTVPAPKKDLTCEEAKCFFCDGGSCAKLGKTVNCSVQLVKFCRHYAGGSAAHA